VRALLLEVARGERAMLSRRLEYTWTARVTDRELDKRGVVKKESSSLYEVYPLRGEFARKLLERDGVPVSRERANQETKRTAERIEKAARDEQKRAEALIKQISNFKRFSSVAGDDALDPPNEKPR
jgi:hypothetical protein